MQHQSGSPQTSSKSTKPLRIVADEMMPLLDQLFASHGELHKRNGREIGPTDISGADALLCRSVTQVDAGLIANSPLRFVGSATIGVDHLDISAFESQRIGWSNAAGCNAAAVAQYVLSAISYWCLQQNKKIQQLTIGIVGVGNVGRRLQEYCERLGIRSKLCDPPRARAAQLSGDESVNWQPLQALMDCDVLTLHVPLTREGEDASWHLIDRSALARLTGQQLLINASRGEVVDNQALLERLQQSNGPKVVLDVFASEPAVDSALINACLLATPHIAGHTLEGKIRGSWMIYQTFCQHFGLPPSHVESECYPPATEFDPVAGSLEQQLLSLYDIHADSQRFKSLAKPAQSPIDPAQFDLQRKNYLQVGGNNWRRDYSGCLLKGDYLPELFKLTEPL